MRKAVKYFVALFLALGLPLSASAAIVTYELNREFSGGTQLAGPAPWLKATLEDTGLNQVTLTMDSGVAFGGLTGAEFVSGWYFNVVPYVSLSFNSPTKVDNISNPTISQGGSYKADGDGYFNLLFSFQRSGGNGKFGANESISYIVSGDSITASSFYAKSKGAGNSPDGLYTAAHVQGIGSNGSESGWITTTPVPVPPSMLLLGSGLIGVVAVRRRVGSGQPEQA